MTPPDESDVRTTEAARPPEMAARPVRRGMAGPARRGSRRFATRRRLVAAGVALTLVAALVTVLAWPDGQAVRTESALVTVDSGPRRDEAVTLDTTLYLPEGATAANPAPAVLVAHGFGGTKASVATDARDLARRGYVVLAWTARGFGRSGGAISLDHPDYEVNDARALLDRLAARADVAKDADGDPRVGVVGASYGGALALLLAAADRRVDAIVPQATWHDLADAFFPRADAGPATDGVFKRAWAGLFFGAGAGNGLGTLNSPLGSAEEPEADGGPAPPATVGTAPSTAGRPPVPAEAAAQAARAAQCGRFSPELCRTYLQVAATGRPTPEAVARLRRSSPAGVLDRIGAPTLLVGGQADTLFPLSETDANARGIAATGTPVRVAWYSGGHDGTGSRRDTDRIRFLTLAWLDHHVGGRGPAPATSFTYSTAGAVSLGDSRPTASAFVTPRYPGLDGARTEAVRLTGAAGPIASPPDGTPAAVSSVPGTNGITALLGGVTLDLPGQHLGFVSAPLDRRLDVVGAPAVRVRAASPTGEAVLFVKLYVVDSSGRMTLPGGGVAPVRLTGLPATLAGARPVEVRLPAIAYRVEAGQRLRVVVATSDQAYATPADPAVYQVDVDRDSLRLPTLAAEPVAGTAALWRWVLVGLLAAVATGVALAVLVARARRRRRDVAVEEDLAATPLVVRGLRKAYGDGYLAVRDLSFRVEPGQVVGLLGPNGAGKTTVLRMLMGLIRPTAGEVLVFGHRVTPGAPVLSRTGAFVEGSGFLPHLSGLANLRRYWQATGRPAQDARMDGALEIAGLGDAVHRTVKTYSQGMLQRLAVAQAMLGLPDLLVLDEPTNGLDPPQIAEMRQVLQRYATDGRAVLVSSHLLAEVEQTCTHVIVMHLGELVTAGPVDELVGEDRTVLVEVSDGSDVTAALAALRPLAGVAASGNGRGVVVELDGARRREVVAALVGAGVGVERVVPRRRLEDVFLALVDGAPVDGAPTDGTPVDGAPTSGAMAGGAAGAPDRQADGARR